MAERTDGQRDRIRVITPFSCAHIIIGGLARMNKAEVLDRIRNKLTLPRALLQILIQMDPQYRLAIQAIDELIEEIKKGMNDETTHE